MWLLQMLMFGSSAVSSHFVHIRNTRGGALLPLAAHRGSRKQFTVYRCGGGGEERSVCHAFSGAPIQKMYEGNLASVDCQNESAG